MTEVNWQVAAFRRVCVTICQYDHVYFIQGYRFLDFFLEPVYKSVCIMVLSEYLFNLSVRKLIFPKTI